MQWAAYKPDACLYVATLKYMESKNDASLWKLLYTVHDCVLSCRLVRQIVLRRTILYSVMALGHRQQATERQISHPKQIKTEKRERIGDVVSKKRKKND